MKKILSLILVGCACSTFANEKIQSCSSQVKQVEITNAVKWYRNSAEKKALYAQGYNLGTQYVENTVKQQHLKPKTWGVILDIDETILDNSWYFRQCGQLVDSESNFSRYVANPHKSVALPGALAFVNLVHKLGGYVSLVSNRDGTFSDNSGKVLDSTLANLRQESVYFDQILLANDNSATPTNKNPRFQAVITGKYDAKQMVWSNELPAHQVIAFFGDNIQDFPEFKQAKMNALTGNEVDYAKFGKGYFIFPNPLYGSWLANQFN
ncbi:MAG: hypothetical protein RLZZ293_1467 [Pseudomonadota bacterium]|jgi:5'-nucleotidase (lipoprotein e(P4) family)